MRLESFRLAASHSVVPASFNITSTLCLASGLKEAFLRHLSPNVLFSGCVSAAIADSPFPDNARSVKQVIAIKFCKFMCFFSNYKCHNFVSIIFRYVNVQHQKKALREDKKPLYKMYKLTQISSGNSPNFQSISVSATATD